MNNRQAKLKELKKLRESGSTRSYDLEVFVANKTDLPAIYDQVTEEQYHQIAKRAALEDDFVVDDNGNGYAGALEDWDNHSEMSDHDDRKRKKPQKDIKKLLAKQASAVPKRAAKAVPEPTATDAELLGSIFTQIDANTAPILKKHKPVPKLAPKPLFVSFVKSEPVEHVPIEPPLLDDPDESFFEPAPEPAQKSTTVQVKSLQTSSSAVSAAKLQKFLPKFEKTDDSVVGPSETAGCKDWRSIKQDVTMSSINVEPNVEMKMDVSENGSILMFWIDAFEKNGILYLFGKMLNSSNQKYESCCLTVNGMMRNLFLLPRPVKLDDNGQNTDIEISMKDVYEEFDALRKKAKIGQFFSKAVTRKYAFELPNIPVESDYLKVVYSFAENPLPLGTSGKSFSHVFGTNTKALELFLLKRRLMGPCWIKITNWTTSSKPISWCKNEIIVNDPKSVAVATEQDNAPKESPPMHVLSLSIRTVMNQHHNSNEIVSATGLIYDTVNVDGETIKLEGKQFTALRQLNDIPLPVNLQAMMKSIKTKVDILPNEKALLSFLIANIHRHDPDIIVGHNVIDFDLDVLLHRMKVNKVEHWSRIGRLRRTQWPKLQDGAGGTGDSSSAERMIASGRLLCDTYRAAQDLLSSKSYSLTYLAATQLKIERANIEYEKIASYFWSAKELVDMIEHSQFDTYLTAQLMFKFQVLPLTKQLTNLAGNLWSRTMMGARAERNEYLLLHEFHNRKYICPDKMPFNQNPLNEEEGAAKKGKKKPAYSGGLVLEPKKGFYDKYVLMLDFNSLYPSIIQEYNICFTSVLRNYDIPDYMPEVPETSVTKGVLPTVLGTLVERRRMVKALLKNPAITAGEYAQFDIRQKALKLTANSMYGCLGFTQSRFYAKPIAMLITSKGREILQNTVTLAESTELEVIYGDTDSIMIHTNTQDLAKVKKMGADLKKAVNKRYNLLEIEMDGFFQKMLLLKKKKYAALAVTEKDGKITTSLETKGLDLVRRDWCGISHDVSNYVLNQLFSENENREEIVDKIHIYLTKVGEQVNAGEIPLDKFVITKSLTKNPEDYADKKTQPHVQVALAMKKRGLVAKIGDTIPFVICKGDDSILAARARHPDDFRDSDLQVDYQWYLNNQIHPPVARLCSPIQGTDIARLANCLGLDVAKYQQSMNASEAKDLFTLESTIPEIERFKDVEKWRPKCNICQHQNEFDILSEEACSNLSDIFRCQNAACAVQLTVGSLSCQLLSAMRKQLNRYLEQRVICDDPACHAQTKATSVFGRKCLVKGCKGLVTLEYSDNQLYTQMQYYERLFSLDPSKDAVEALYPLSSVVMRFLNVSARRWVSLDQVFGFLQC